MHKKHHVVITGAVAAGKTSVAHHLGGVLRSEGFKTGIVDLDELYRMVRQREGFDDLETWKITRGTARVLADSLYRNGFDAVMLEGGIHSASEHTDIRRHITCSVQETFVTLLVSAAEALRRARDDPHPERVDSRHPDLQALLYADFEKALPFLQRSSIILPADDSGAEELAGKIAGLVLKPEKTGPPRAT